jgi:aminomethyltransferase
MNSNLSHTQLYDWHKSHGAKTADFGGWDMPIEYSGVVLEHEAVRTSLGIFDVSHMGKIEIFGTQSVAWLNSVLTNDLENLTDGKAQYSMLLNELGGVIDDLIVYRFSSDLVWIVPNASNATDVFNVLESLKPDAITIVNHHKSMGIIAVQGQNSIAAIQSLNLPKIEMYMSAIITKLKGEEIILCRSGYTGEVGFEIIAPNEILLEVWNDLINFGATPVGLAARDTLRLEMGYALHGHEISQEINPIEAGLSWAVALDKPKFQGRESVLDIKAGGPKRKRVALSALERGIPRAEMNVLAGELVIGHTTSGTFSPTMKNGIALALVDPSVKVGDQLELDVRGRKLKVEVVKLPFVQAKTV